MTRFHAAILTLLALSACNAPAPAPTYVEVQSSPAIAQAAPQRVELPLPPPPPPPPEPERPFVRAVRRVAVFGTVPKQQRYTERDIFMIETKNALRNTGAFEVVTRRHIGEIQEEQNLLSQGMLDERTAPKLGAIYGVGYLVESVEEPTGPSQGSFHVCMMLIDTDTGAIVASGESAMPRRGDAVTAAARSLAEECNRLPLKAGDVIDGAP